MDRKCNSNSKEIHHTQRKTHQSILSSCSYFLLLRTVTFQGTLAQLPCLWAGISWLWPSLLSPDLPNLFFLVSLLFWGFGPFLFLNSTGLLFSA